MLTNYQGERQTKDTSSEVTQILELSGENFKTTIIAMLQEVTKMLLKQLEGSQSQQTETTMRVQMKNFRMKKFNN